MTALIGGMRVLNTNFDQSKHGVFTELNEFLTNDFFKNLLDPNIDWKPITDDRDIFEGKDIESGSIKWTATRVDLIFGSNSELRAISEVYGSNDGEEQFLDNFSKAWEKVMNLDRFDL